MDEDRTTRTDEAGGAGTGRLGISPMLAFRCAIAGVLMGLANLVPGISGGTMLVVSGIYTRFIDAISDLTRLRFRLESIAVLAVVVTGALAAIALLAGLVATLMVESRWVMYSIFVGLTWGSVPVIVSMARPIDRRVWVGALIGASGMVALAVTQSSGGGSVGTSNTLLLLLAGVAGASAMILPGVSGTYLLLLLGQYLPILESVDRLTEGVIAFDFAASMSEARIVVPVAIGVVVGITGVSNLLRWLLHRYEKVTLGVLLGLVIGAPAGLYPFKRGIEPVVGDEVHGIVVTDANLTDLLDEPSKWREQTFAPSAGQIAGSLALLLLGGGATLGIAHLGRERRPARPES